MTPDPDGAERHFYKAHDAVIEAGFQHEIDYYRDCRLENLTANDFALEYTFAILSSTGLHNQLVQRQYNTFLETVEKGENPYAAIKNRRLRAAAEWCWTNYEQVFETIKKQPTDEAKIEYLQTLPQIGKKEKYHLARNIGIDCVKPDRHMERLAEKFGYVTPDAMCRDIQKRIPLKERIGVIDLILWRHCNLQGGK